MRTMLNDHLRGAAVRAAIAADDLSLRLEDAATRRARALRDDGERGAQAAEYAMLGGVSAAACGCLIVVLNQSEGRLGGFLDTVLGVIGRLVRGWLG
jgi:hypothetical protein